jgi:hypothetical protein
MIFNGSRIESHRHKARKETRKQHRSLLEYPWWNSGSVTTTELLRNKDAYQESESQYASPDFRILP